MSGNWMELKQPTTLPCNGIVKAMFGVKDHMVHRRQFVWRHVALQAYVNNSTYLHCIQANGGCNQPARV